MSLTTFQVEVITGLLLGDGNLQIGGRAKNPRLRINRSAVDAKYIEWTRDVFADYCSDKAVRYFTSHDKRYDKTYQKVSLVTRRHEDLLPVYEAWYPDGIRKLPDNIELTPTTIAVWFADDGSLYQKTKNGVTSGVELTIATASFGGEGSNRLAVLLNNRYGGGFNVYGGYGGPTSKHYKIMSSTRPARRLIEDVDSVFPPMLRKTGLWRSRAPVLDLEKMLPPCEHCGVDAVYRNGFYTGRGTKRLARRFKCGNCNRGWKVPL